MDNKQFVGIMMGKQLWKKFGQLVVVLKKLELLEPHETRSSIVRDFIQSFVIAKEQELEMYERSRSEMENGK